MEFNAATLRNKGVPISLNIVQEDEPGSDRWSVVMNDQGTAPRVETVWIKFTANELADIEDEYNGVSFVVTEKLTQVKTNPVTGEDVLDDEGKQVIVYTGERKQYVETYNGLDGFQKASVEQPVKTIRKTLSTILGRSPAQVGAGFIADQTQLYSQAVAAAFAMATGTDPESVGKVLEAQRIQAKKTAAAALERADKMLEEAQPKTEEEAVSVPETPTSSNGQTGSPPGSDSETEASMSSGNSAPVN